jgi:phenylpropionate dioxygenase-like ring-hydroxylating dioxygenase large terminal subunit
VKKGRIQCPYHGWVFGKNGRCEFIPGLSIGAPGGQCNAQAFNVTEQNGLIWINLNSDAPKDTVPSELLCGRGIPSDQFVISAEVNASLPNALENLLDGFHTPFVHAGLVRSTKNPQHLTARIKALEDRVEIQYSGEQGQSGWISQLLERGRTSSFGRFINPSIAQIEYCSSSGTTLLITTYFTPICSDRQRAYAVVETPRGILPGFIKRFVLGLLFRRVLEQDRKILELQSRNISRFKEEKFVSTRLDLVRPYLMKMLSPSQRHSIRPVEKTESFEL